MVLANPISVVFDTEVKAGAAKANRPEYTAGKIYQVIAIEEQRGDYKALLLNDYGKFSWVDLYTVKVINQEEKKLHWKQKAKLEDEQV